MAGAATVDKALDVLFHLHSAAGALGLSEIGRDLDLPKSSCHRLLTSLVDREVVERDGQGRYRPGLALISLGLGAQAREPVVRAARPVLEIESEAFGETVFLVARRRSHLRVLDKCDGAGFLRAAPEIGDVIPEEVTAVGQLYRAHASESPAASGATSVGFSAEDDDLYAVSERGYALNRDAWIDGLSVLAVPVWQTGGVGRRQLVAALALGAASPRFDDLGETPVAERLLAAALAVEERLGPAVSWTSPRRARRPAEGKGPESASFPQEKN